MSGGNFNAVNAAGFSEISGGTINGELCVESGGRMTIHGGQLKSGFLCKVNSQSQVAGGSFNGTIGLEANASLRLIGTEFRLLDAVTDELIQDLTPILDSLPPGEAFEVPDRNVVLEGTVDDGTAFQFELNSVQAPGQDFAETGSLVSIARDFPVSDLDLVTPTNIYTFRGIDLSPSEHRVFECSQSDNIYAQYHPGFVLNNVEARTWLVFEGTVPRDFLDGTINFCVESSALTPGLEPTFEVREPQTSFNYHVVETFDESFNVDVVKSVEFPTEFVDPSTMEVAARVGWRRVGFTISYPWEVRVDHVYWASED